MYRSLMKHPTHLNEIPVPGILLPIRAAALLGLLFLSPILQGQQGPKIAVISMQKTLATTQEGQKASRDLAAKVNPKQQEFNTRQQEISQLQNQLKTGQPLSDQKKGELSQEIETKKKRLERDTRDADEALRSEQQGFCRSSVSG